MKQRASPAAPTKSPLPIQGDGPDPFRFGWRYARGTNGSQELRRIPLTPADVLHPQKGDHIPENSVQMRDRVYLLEVLKMRTSARPGWLVLADVLINWGIPGLGNHSPDAYIMENVRATERAWSTFYVAAERAQPVLAIEIVSVHDDDPDIRDNDVKVKVQEYYQAGVPLYIIVDQEEEEGPRQVRGFRRGKKQFVEIAPDTDGRLLLEPVGLWIGLRDELVVCYDAATGEEIPDYTGLTQARQQAERARADEAQARQQAERARADEAQARQQAEAALAAAQARIQELEAQAKRPRRPRKR